MNFVDEEEENEVASFEDTGSSSKEPEKEKDEIEKLPITVEESEEEQENQLKVRQIRISKIPQKLNDYVLFTYSEVMSR